MEIDFTKNVLKKDEEREQMPYYHNFILSDENPFDKDIYQYKFLVDCIYEAKVYASNVEDVIKWSLEYPFEQCVKILYYLRDKLENYIKNIAFFLK